MTTIRDGLLAHIATLETALAQARELLAQTEPAQVWAWPVLGIPHRVTQSFDAPTSYGRHEGVDFDCYDNDTGALCRIAACADGVVVEVNRWDGTKNGLQNYGHYVLIQHGEYWARYCHLSALLVRAGEAVAGGSVIGVGGNSGNSRGAHLHLTVTHPDAPPVYVYQQRAVNPLALIEDV